MNTDRDNFHDWARDKPDTTSFSGLHRNEISRYDDHRPGMNWGRLGWLVVFAVVLVTGARYLSRFVLT